MQALLQMENVESLLIYNRRTINDVSPGYYYWYENSWRKPMVSSDINIPSGVVIWDETNNQFTYIDASGNTQIINIESLVQDAETVTTLTKGNLGTYKYISEDDTVTTIGVVADVINNATTIFNHDSVTNEITEIIKVEETVSPIQILFLMI